MNPEAQIIQRLEVAVHAEVVVVAEQLACESLVLLPDRVVSMTSTPLEGGLDCPPEARTPSPECHPLQPGFRTTPVRRETEEVEGSAPRVVAVARRPE